MSYIGQQLPADSFQGFTTDSFAGDGSATTFTLSKTPFNESALLVVINNVVQKPTTNFTVSGTTLTIVGTAVASGDVIYATHIGGALPIGQAASLDLNGASDQLILDADADTTISADTDDQIDIKIAGADDFQFTANTFTAQSGSTITTPTLGVGNTKDLGAALHVKVSDSGATVDGNYDTVVIEESGHSGIAILSGTSSIGLIGFGDSGAALRGYVAYSHTNDQFEIATAGAERMRINSSGNIMIGTTTESARLHIASATTAGTDPLVVFSDGSGTDCGSIDLNASANTVAYTTSSDYRLKENVVTDWDATTRLKQLKPSRFNFIADADTTVDGFLAHEVSSIVPEAITGVKDETKTKTKVVLNSNGHVIAEGIEEADWTAGKVADEEDNTKYPTDSTWEASKVVPVYQGIDQSKLVPLLVKTVQELEARIAALEGN
jgi:hypothetical protein